MPIIQSLATGCSNTQSSNFSGSSYPYISNKVIYSTPAPIPTSSIPALILAATIAQASKPEEHHLLTAYIQVVSGKPAKNRAILEVMAPAPG
jgi:hypothetical protein